MAYTSDDLAAKLVTDAVGTLATAAAQPTNSIFTTSMAYIPTGDGPYLTLVDTGGTGPLSTHDGMYPRTSVQVVSRASTAAAAKALALAAFASLCPAARVVNTVINGTFYLQITPVQSEPFDIGQDQQRRLRYAFNVMTLKRAA